MDFIETAKIPTALSVCFKRVNNALREKRAKCPEFAENVWLAQEMRNKEVTKSEVRKELSGSTEPRSDLWRFSRVIQYSLAAL